MLFFMLVYPGGKKSVCMRQLGPVAICSGADLSQTVVA
jgi:hypothetical protein